MNKKQTLLIVFVAFLMILSFTSCQMYAGNFYKNIDDKLVAKGKAPLFGDDISKLLDNASASDVADAVANANTPDEARGALEALGKKPVAEIKNLDKDQKNEVLEAQVLATLGGSDTTKAIKDLVSGNTDDLDENTLMDTFVGAAAGVDTTATSVILESSVTTNGNNVPVLNEDLDKSAVASAAASVAVSTMSDAGVKDFSAAYGKLNPQEKDDLDLYFSGCKDSDGNTVNPATNTDDIAAALLGSEATQQQKKNLATAISALSAAGGMESLLGLAGSL